MIYYWKHFVCSVILPLKATLCDFENGVFWKYGYFWKFGVTENTAFWNFWRFSKIWLFWKIWQPLTIWLHLTTLAFLILAFLEELGDFVLGRLCFGEILSAGRFCTGGIMGVNLIFFHPVAKSLLIDSYLIESIPHFLDHLLSCPLIRCPFLSC